MVSVFSFWGKLKERDQATGVSMSDQEILNGLIDVPQPQAALMLEAGYFYMEMNKFKEAEDIFTGVAALLPVSEVPHICLGNLYFAQGKFQRALKSHEEALKLNPESLSAQTHIGEALLFLGKTEDGIAKLQGVINSSSGDPSEDFAKALLDAHEAGELK